MDAFSDIAPLRAWLGDRHEVHDVAGRDVSGEIRTPISEAYNSGSDDLLNLHGSTIR